MSVFEKPRRFVGIGQLVTALWTIIALSSGALAGDMSRFGDGSGTNNNDLFRDHTTGCENCRMIEASSLDYGPPVDIDWSLGLRGAYVQGPTRSYFEAVAVPSVTIRHDFLRGSLEAKGEAELIHSSLEEFRLGAFRGGLTGRYQLDEWTQLSGYADLSVGRESAANDPAVLEKPLTLEGDVGGSIERRFGPIAVTLRGAAARSIYGETTLAGPVLVDNSDNNNTLAETGLRVGYRVTPIVTAFVDGNVGQQMYDNVSSAYLVRLDATDFEGRIGLAGNWHEVLTAEASIGYGLRRFADVTLGETSAILYDARVTFKPDETLEIGVSLGSSFDAPGVDTVATARLDYVAEGNVAYTVNPWLRLRANAGWYHTAYAGSIATETGYRAGVGADYLLNEHTTLSADYGYSAKRPSSGPAEDEHRVTLGVTFSN